MKQCIFIHIPRTAGRSIERFAEQYSPSYQICVKHRWEDTGQFTTLRHRAGGWFLRKGYISQEWWDNSLKFAVVRNPWDRLVSLYEYLRRFRLKRRSRYSNQFLQSFDLFANGIIENPRLVAPVWKQNVRWFSQANPQIRWLSWGVDRIIRFENLMDEWNQFCIDVGFPNEPLPHHHRGNRKKDYRSYYTDQLTEDIGRFYQEDIDRFYYEF